MALYFERAGVCAGGEVRGSRKREDLRCPGRRQNRGRRCGKTNVSRVRCLDCLRVDLRPNNHESDHPGQSVHASSQPKTSYSRHSPHELRSRERNAVAVCSGPERDRKSERCCRAVPEGITADAVTCYRRNRGFENPAASCFPLRSRQAALECPTCCAAYTGLLIAMAAAGDEGVEAGGDEDLRHLTRRY